MRTTTESLHAAHQPVFRLRVADLEQPTLEPAPVVVNVKGEGGIFKPAIAPGREQQGDLSGLERIRDFERLLEDPASVLLASFSLEALRAPGDDVNAGGSFTQDEERNELVDALGHLQPDGRAGLALALVAADLQPDEGEGKQGKDGDKSRHRTPRDECCGQTNLLKLKRAGIGLPAETVFVN